MRVIICGAGQVGYNIAAYLAREDNDVTVIDIEQSLITQINDTLDVNGIVGHASNPEVLSNAGAGGADLIVAVTHSDEVNMISCQVAHSLFSIPKKIARVRNQSYLKAAWSNLFSRSHMPIDVIISPEVEVAHAINHRLRVPGTTNVISLADNKVSLVGVLCGEECPLVNTPLKQLTSLFPDLSLKIGAIIRNSEAIVPTGEDQMLVGDEVYFFADTKHLKRAMYAFGHEEVEARNVVIMGGGNIGLYLANLLKEQQKGIKIKIIESNKERAVFLSEEMDNDVVVLHGDALKRSIMEEAEIATTETVVAVTNDDEANILGSLLAKQKGCERVITLVNKPSYMPLIHSLGIDATVSPRSSTVASIMQYVRRGRIKALHNLGDGIVEAMEAEASEASSIINIPFSELNLPEHMIIGAVVRKDKVIMPDANFYIKPGDHVMLLATQDEARNVEKLFMTHVDF
jgi:trk system potassium uptake protein TrkA